MGSNYDTGNKSLKNAFGSPDEVPDTPAAAKNPEDVSKDDAPSTGGVFETLMKNSIDLGGAMGGGAVYETISGKKAKK